MNAYIAPAALPPRISPEALAARREALIAHAKQQGIDCVLVYGPGSSLGAGTAAHGALRYLSDWDGVESTALLVCTPVETLLLVGSPFLLPLAQLRFAHTDIQVIDARPQAWASTLEARLSGSGPIGTLGFEEIPAPIRDSLQATARSREWVPLAYELDRMRLQKDDAAVALHRAAAGLCDELFEALGRELATRRPAWQIQAALEGRAKQRGAEYCRTWLTVGPMADYPRYWRDECLRVPQAGDQVMLGIMLMVEGHWGHGIRMGNIGPQAPAHQQLWSVTKAMLDAGAVALTSGSPLDAVEGEMNRVLEHHYTPSVIAGMTRFRNGHGLGMSYEEPLSTRAFSQHFDRTVVETPASGVAVAPGMLFELHPNFFIPDVGGAALGEMVLVTPQGPERLLTFPLAPADWS